MGMEQESGTFMFMANDSRGEERLLIFGINKGTKDNDGGRMQAERLVKDMIKEAKRNGSSRRRRPRSSSRSDSRSRRRKSPARKSPGRRSPARRSRSPARR